MGFENENDANGMNGEAEAKIDRENSLTITCIRNDQLEFISWDQIRIGTLNNIYTRENLLKRN